GIGEGNPRQISPVPLSRPCRRGAGATYPPPPTFLLCCWCSWWLYSPGEVVRRWGRAAGASLGVGGTLREASVESVGTGVVGSSAKGSNLYDLRGVGAVTLGARNAYARRRPHAG